MLNPELTLSSKYLNVSIQNIMQYLPFGEVKESVIITMNEALPRRQQERIEQKRKRERTHGHGQQCGKA